jgi:hypothetical protein
MVWVPSAEQVADHQADLRERAIRPVLLTAITTDRRVRSIVIRTFVWGFGAALTNMSGLTRSSQGAGGCIPVSMVECLEELLVVTLVHPRPTILTLTDATSTRVFVDMVHPAAAAADAG